MASEIHNYSMEFPYILRRIAAQIEDGLESHLLVVNSAFNSRQIVEIIKPEMEGDYPAILYVHWYEPEAQDSNRHQFQAEAREMARRGAVCLLIETMWSDPDFFYKRTQEDDVSNSVKQVIDLRRAFDFLLEQPGVDPGHFAYVGHDFGGMYGVLVGGVDPRPTHYVIMAATTRFPDWYLYYPPLEGESRETFIEEMKEFDPIEHVASLAPAPLLFQFAEDDFHVPKERAETFFAAAREPKEIRWYQAGHGLNESAAEDRIAWLARELKL